MLRPRVTSAQVRVVAQEKRSDFILKLTVTKGEDSTLKSEAVTGRFWGFLICY